MEYEGNNCEIEMSSVFITSPNFIHHFESVKLTWNQKNKLDLGGQTYTWTKIIESNTVSFCLGG